LIVEELPNEVLVYDLNTDKAHCLNRTAALIWKNCDGEKTEGEIAGLPEQELKSPVSTQVVMLGLEEQAGYGLLREDASVSTEGARISAPANQTIRTDRGDWSAHNHLHHRTDSSAGGRISSPDPCIANPRAQGCPCGSDADCDSANCNIGICGPPLLPSKKR